MPSHSHLRHHQYYHTRGQGKFGKVMREYYHGTLHSGSKHGPIVHSAAQAKAIAAHESGLSKQRHA